MSKEKVIKLINLELNTENPRFDILAGQKEAIDKMLDEQGENLYNLANHILKNDFNPIDKILVISSKKDPKKFTVLEGNRRIASLKIVSNPDLIDDKKFDNLKKKFKNLNKNNEDQFPLSVPCIVLENEKEAELWIGIKHGGLQAGIGTDSWDSIQKQRFEEKRNGKSSIALQFINFLKTSDGVPNEIKLKIDSIKTTNVDRLLGDTYVRNSLGIEVNNGVLQSTIQEKEVLKGLNKVAQDLLDPKFTVGKIYDVVRRKEYIDSLTSKQKPDLKKKSEQPWQLNSAKVKGPVSVNESKSGVSQQGNKQRKKLIPSRTAIKINQPRINAIFVELQSLDINSHKNAVSVLFRVFLELSIDYYLEQKKLIQATSSQKSGLSLRDKTFQAISHLTNRGLIDQAISKGIRNAVKDDNSILGTETWHAYVHNHRFSPIPQNMLLTWDSMQEFVTILWNDIV